jgi:hypothetical protein
MFAGLGVGIGLGVLAAVAAILKHKKNKRAKRAGEVIGDVVEVGKSVAPSVENAIRKKP